MALNDVLQYFLVVGPLFGVLYAPFHFLDKYASPGARIKAQLAIRAGQANTDMEPLGSLLEACFGPKHFSLRCIALSSAMSLVFTVLFLGVVNAYVINLADYFERREVAAHALEEAIAKAYPAILGLYDAMLPAFEADKSPEGQRKLTELKERRAELVRMKENPVTPLATVLLWMLFSVIVSMNLLCDYVALGKTRFILRQLNKTESRLAVGPYLVLDLLLAVVIWLASMAIFLYFNTDTFLKWADSEPSLVSVVAIVSLATTIATSIWIYTYLLGNILSKYLRRFIQLLLRGTTSLIDPYEHTFKVIGIVGSIAMLIFWTVVYLAFVVVV